MSRKPVSKILLLAYIMLLTWAPGAGFCLPEIDEVVEGDVQVTYPDANTMSITATDNSIINYSSFDIMEGESLIVTLPSVDSEILNRALGPDASQLLGNLDCNGLFVLVNESGIYIGPSANLDLGSVVLSTRDITNQNFLNGDYLFQRIDTAQADTLLLNEGTIQISEEGFAALIAGAIENRGAVIARMGKIALASGDAVRLEISADGLIGVAIEEPVAREIVDFDGNPITDQINNSGTLDAEGGAVILKAESLGDIFARSINLEGVVKGARVEESDGVIRIVADGDVRISADLQATEIEIGDMANEIIPDNVVLEEGALVSAEELITISAEYYINIECAITAPDIVLEANGGIDTTDAAIIQATNLNLISNKFGSYEKALNIDAGNIHIELLNGDFNIIESTGIGTSIQLRGPPEEWGAVLCSTYADVTIETREGGIYVVDSVNIELNNLTLIANGDIYSTGALIISDTLYMLATGPIMSFGVINTDILIESGATFGVGGVCEVSSAYMDNADGAGTLYTGDYSGDYSDTGDITVYTNAAINLTGACNFTADSDSDGAGRFSMDTGSYIYSSGSDQSLIIGTSGSGYLRDISGVTTLTLNPQTTSGSVSFYCYDTISCQNLTIGSGETNFTFDANDQNINATGDVYMGNGNVARMGNGTWTVGGNFNYAAVANFYSEGSTLKMTGNGSLTGSTSTLYNLEITSSGYVTVPAASSTVYVDNLLTLDGDLSISTGELFILSTGTCNMGDGSSITGLGTFRMVASSAGNDFNRTGTTAVNVSTFEWYYGNATGTLAAGTYASATFKFIHSSGANYTLTLENGTYTFAGDVTFQTTSTGHYYIANNTNNPTFIFEGDVLIAEGSTGQVEWTAGSNTITLQGGNAQNIDLDNEPVEDIIINKTVGTTATLTGALNTQSLDIDAGSFDAVTFAVTVSGDVIADNGSDTIDMGNNTWTVGGTFDILHVGTFNYEQSTVKMTGTGDLITDWTNDLYNLQIDSSAVVTVPAAAGYPQILNSLTVDGTLTISSGEELQVLGATLTLNGTGEINGLGRLTFTNCSAGEGFTTFAGSLNVADVQIKYDNGGTYVGGLYNGNLEILVEDATHRSVALSNDTYTISGNLTLHCSSTGNLTINNVNNPSFEISGNVVTQEDSTGQVSWTAGSGTITFQGGNAQQVDFNNLAVEDIIINKTAATTLTLTDHLNTQSIDSNTGSFDAATFNVTVSGDVIVDTVDTFDLGSNTWTVSGHFDCEDVGTLDEGTSTLILNGNTKNLITAGGAYNDPLFYDLTISGSITLNSVGASTIYLTNGSARTLDITGTFTITSGKDARIWTNSGLNIGGSGELTGSGATFTVGLSSTTDYTTLFTNSGTISIGTFRYSLGGSSNVTVPAYNYGGNLTFQNTNVAGATANLGTGTLTVGGTLKINHNNGNTITFDVSGFDNDINVGGDWDLSPGGVFTCGNSTVTFNGTAQTILDATTFYHLVVASSTQLDINSVKINAFDATINANCTLRLDNASDELETTDSVTNNGVITQSAGTLDINDTTDYQGLFNEDNATYTISGGACELADSLMNRGGIVNISGSANISVGLYFYNVASGSGNQINMTGGTVSCAQFPNYQGTVSHSGGTITSTGYYNENNAVGGAYYGSGTAELKVGTWIYVKSAGTYFNDLTITTSGAYVHASSQQALDINGDFTIEAGASFDTNYDLNGTANMEVAGNWNNQGSFIHGNGTVTFNGDAAQTITPTTFYDLVIANTHLTAEVTITSGTVTVSNTLDVNDGIFSIDTGDTLDVNGDALNAVDVANGATLKIDGGTVTVDGGNAAQIDIAAGGTLDIVSGDVTSQGTLVLDGTLKMAAGTLNVGNTTDVNTFVFYIGAAGGSDTGDVTGGTINITAPAWATNEHIIKVEDGGKFLPTVTTDDTGNIVVLRTSNVANYIWIASTAPNYSNVIFNRLQIGDASYPNTIMDISSYTASAPISVYNKFTIYSGSTFDHTNDANCPIYVDKFVCDGTYTKVATADRFYFIDGDGTPGNGSISGSADPQFGNLDIGNGSSVTVTLSRGITADSLDVASNAILDMNGQTFNFTNPSTEASNAGTIRLIGNESFGGNVANLDIDSGIVEIVGNGGSGTFTIQDFGATDYFDLTINGAAAETFQIGDTKTLTVANDLTITQGIFDNAAYDENVSVTRDVTMDNTRTDMGNGTWTIGRHFDYQHVTTFNDDASTIKMTGTGNLIGKDSTYINNLTIDSGADITIPAASDNLIYQANTGILLIDGQLEITSGKAIYTWGEVKVGGTGAVLTGAGQLRFYSGGGSDGLTQFTAGGVISIDDLRTVNSTGFRMAPGTYDVANVRFQTWGANSNINFDGGTYVFNGNVTIGTYSSGSMNMANNGVSGSTSITINGTFTMAIGASASGNLTINNSGKDVNWVITGNVATTISGTGIFTWTKGLGTIKLTGSSGTQTIDFEGQSIEALEIDANGATKQLTNAATIVSLTVTNGSFDVNGQTLTNDGSTTITGGTYEDASGGDLTLSQATGDFIQSGGTLQTSGSGNINIDVTSGLAIINSLSAGGNVVIGGTNAPDRIIATNSDISAGGTVTITCDNVGTFSNPLVITSATSYTVNANNGSAHIKTGSIGDLNITGVSISGSECTITIGGTSTVTYNTANYLMLETVNGDITYSDAENDYIQAKNLKLIAGNAGAIGTISNYFLADADNVNIVHGSDIYIKFYDTTTLTRATGTGDQTIETVSGDLIIGTISTTGAVNLTAAGNILNDNDLTTKITAGLASEFRAESGTIGTYSNALDLYIATGVSVTVYATTQSNGRSVNLVDSNTLQTSDIIKDAGSASGVYLDDTQVD